MGGNQGRDCELTNPDTSMPVDVRRVAEALLEEPDAFIAHVRVCGGAGWVTIGSTRQPTLYSLRSASAFGRGSPPAFGCAGTHQHDVTECKSLTAKVSPTTLAPSQARTVGTASVQR